MSSDPARELFTATDSSFQADFPTNAYRDGTMRDVSHAVTREGVALCGGRPAFGRDGTPFPLRQFESGSAEVCSTCAGLVAS
jgi:hypothetical protein